MDMMTKIAIGLLVIGLGLFVIYIGVRLASVAYFKSKREHEEAIIQQHLTETEEMLGKKERASGNSF